MVGGFTSGKRSTRLAGLGRVTAFGSHTEEPEDEENGLHSLAEYRWRAAKIR